MVVQRRVVGTGSVLLVLMGRYTPAASRARNRKVPAEVRRKAGRQGDSASSQGRKKGTPGWG
jgi:hypothetical protein